MMTKIIKTIAINSEGAALRRRFFLSTNVPFNLRVNIPVAFHPQVIEL